MGRVVLAVLSKEELVDAADHHHLGCKVLAGIAALYFDSTSLKGDLADFGQVVAQLLTLGRLDHQCRG